MPKKIRESREELRNAMIATAERVIVSDGVTALTARRLASELGIAVGTTYNVFKDMSSLVEEVNALTIARITEGISGVDASAGSDEDILMCYADAYIGFVTENQNLWAALFHGEVHPDSPSHQRNLANTLKLFGFLETTLSSIAPQADKETVAASARALWAAVHGMLSLVAGNRHVILGLGDIRETIRVLVHNHVAGMRAGS
ncbi:MAG: WHG domain-containing protein [Pseudomonadota bacterium]